MSFHANGWHPNTVIRTIRLYSSATRTVHVDTELGEGFLKGLGNPEGPHALACELVGSMAASWLGLKTFDFSIINVNSPDEVATSEGSLVDPGPAFISRAEPMGFTWGGDAQTIAQISNVADITRLVVLDSWLRNCDRYAPDGRRINLKNVFLIQRTQPHRALELYAMDFTHAFTCGSALDRRISNIDRVKDPAIYGLFPEFRPHLSRAEVRRCAGRLEAFVSNDAENMVSEIPVEWQVNNAVRSTLKKFLIDRAHFSADTIEARLWPETDDLQYPGDVQ